MATPFTTSINYRETPPEFEKVDPRSQTQPDMTLSLRELLDRYAKGLPVTLRDDGYFEEEDYSEFDGMDIADIDEMKARNKDHIESLESEFEKIQKAKSEAKQKKKKEASDDTPPEDAPTP